jgi:hypothetical protein
VKIVASQATHHDFDGRLAVTAAYMNGSACVATCTCRPLVVPDLFGPVVILLMSLEETLKKISKRTKVLIELFIMDFWIECSQAFCLSMLWILRYTLLHPSMPML